MISLFPYTSFRGSHCRLFNFDTTKYIIYYTHSSKRYAKNILLTLFSILNIIRKQQVKYICIIILKDSLMRIKELLKEKGLTQQGISQYGGEFLINQ